MAGWVRETVLAPFLKAQSRWVVERDLRSAFARLREERDSLSAEVVVLQDAAQESERLRRLLNLAARARPSFAAANLVPSGRGPAELQTFLLDVGRRRGIEPPAPVVTASGLVGVVRSASADHSAGDFWSHPDFRASAMTQDGQAFGIVRPAASVPGEPASLLLAGVPYQVELAPGTRVVTSGLGGVLPRGVPVGFVRELVRAEEGWAKTYRLDPAVHPGSAVEVLVMTGMLLATDWTTVWPAGGAVESDTAGR